MESRGRGRSFQRNSFLFSIPIIYVLILTVVLLCIGQSSGSHLAQARRRPGSRGANDTRGRAVRQRNVFQPARFSGRTSTSTRGGRGSRQPSQNCSPGQACERTQSRSSSTSSRRGQRSRLTTGNSRRSRTRTSSRNSNRQSTRGSSRTRSNSRSKTRSSTSPKNRRRSNFRTMTNDQASRRMRDRGRNSPAKSGSNSMRNDINRFLNGIRSSLPSNLGIGLGISLPSNTGRSSSSQGRPDDRRSDSSSFDSRRSEGSRRSRGSRRFSSRSRGSGRTVQLQQPVLITDNEAPVANPLNDQTIVFQDPITGTSVMEVTTPPPSNTFSNSWSPGSGLKDAATALFVEPPQDTFLFSQRGQGSMAPQPSDSSLLSQNTGATQDLNQGTSGQMFASNTGNQPLSGQGFNSNQQGNIASNDNFISSDMSTNQELLTTNQNFDQRFGTQNSANDNLNAGNTVGQGQSSVMSNQGVQNVNQETFAPASGTMQIQGQMSGINSQTNALNSNQQIGQDQSLNPFNNNNQIQGQTQMQVSGATFSNSDTFMQPIGTNDQGQINAQTQVNNMQFLGQGTGTVGQNINIMGQNQNNFNSNQGQVQEQMQGQIQPMSNTLLSNQGQFQGQVQPIQGNTLSSNQGQIQGQVQGQVQPMQSNALLNNQGQFQGQLQVQNLLTNQGQAQGPVQSMQGATFLNNQGQNLGQIQPLQANTLQNNQGQIQGQMQGQVQVMPGNTFVNNQGQFQGQIQGQVQNLQGNTFLSNQGPIQGQIQGQVQSMQGNTMLQNNNQIQGQIMNNQNQMLANNLVMNQQLPSFNQSGVLGQNVNSGMLNQGMAGQNQGIVSVFGMNQDGNLNGQVQNNMQSNMNFDGNVAGQTQGLNQGLVNSGGTGRLQQANDLGLANNLQNQNIAMTLSEQVQQLQNQLNQLQMAANLPNLQGGVSQFSNTGGTMQSLGTQMQNTVEGNMISNQAQINAQSTNLHNSPSQFAKQETSVVNNNMINSGSPNPSLISPTQSSGLNSGSKNAGGWFPIDVNGNQSPSEPVGIVDSLKPTVLQQPSIDTPKHNLNASGLATTDNPLVNTTHKTLMIQIDPKSRGVKIVPDGQGGVKVISLRSAVTISPFGQENSNRMSFLMKNSTNLTLNMSDIHSETASGFSHDNSNFLNSATNAPPAEQQLQKRVLVRRGTTPSLETLHGLGPNDRINTTDVPEEYEFPNGSSPDVWPSNANKPKPKPDREGFTHNLNAGTTPSFETLSGLGPNDRIKTTDVPEEYEFPNGSSPDVWPSNANKPKPKPDRPSVTPNPGSGEVTATPPTTPINEEAASFGEEEYEGMNAIDIAALDAYLMSETGSIEGSYNHETNQLLEQLTRIYESSSTEIGSVADVVRGILKQQLNGDSNNEQGSEGGSTRLNENNHQRKTNSDATAADFNTLIKKLNEVLHAVKHDKSAVRESTTPATNVEPVMKFYNINHGTNKARVLKKQTYHTYDYSHMSTIEIIDAIAKLVNLTSTSPDSRSNGNGEAGQQDLLNKQGENVASVLQDNHDKGGNSHKDYHLQGSNHNSEIHTTKTTADRVSLALSVGNGNKTDLEPEVTQVHLPTTESFAFELPTTESVGLELGFNGLETTTAARVLPATDPYTMHFGDHHNSYQNTPTIEGAGHSNSGKHPEHNILQIIHQTINANPDIMFKDITRSKKTMLSNDMPPR